MTTAAADREPLTDRGRRTREAVLSSARSVFEEQGYGATRMGDIASAAGVAHALELGGKRVLFRLGEARIRLRHYIQLFHAV